MVEAATEFKKSGFSDEDSAQLAKVASLYQNIADEQISAGEASNFIISQMKAFNLTADDSEHIIDAVNNVSNNMAVSSADLATNIGKASAALATGNNTYEETLALLTGITEITRSGTKAARGLVSIQSRLNQIVDESSSTGKALTAWYEEHNIAIYDQAGQLRKLYDILHDVAEIWPELTTNEKDYYLNQQAGANQSVNLAAALSNFDDVEKALTLALDANGSALAENTAYMESLEAKTNNLKATFQDLATNVIDDELVGSVLDLANGFLQLANTDLGRIVTQITLLTGVGWGATSLAKAADVVGAAGKSFDIFFSLIKNGSVATAKSLSKAGKTVSEFGAIMGGALPVVLAFAAALAIGGALWKATEDSRKSIDELNDSIETDNQKLQTNKARLDEINGMAWNDKTPEILAEKDALEKENAELQKQIEKYQQLKSEKAQAILDNAYGTETTYETRRVRGKETVVPVTELVEGAKYYEQLTLKLQQYQTILSQNKSLTAEQVVEYNNLTAEAGRLASAMENVEGGVAGCTNEQQLMYNTLQSTQVAYNDAQTYISNYVNKLLEQAEKTGVAKNELYNLAAQMVATNNQQLNFSQQIAALQQLATQAGYSASAIAAVMGMSNTSVQNQIRASAAGLMQQAHYAGKKLSSEEAMRQASQAYMKNLWGSLTTFYQPSASTTTPTGGTSVPTYTSPSSSKQTQKNKEEAKDAVKEVGKTAETAVDNVSDQVSDALNEQKQMMQGVIDYYVEYASRKIDELQDQIDAINDKYDQMLQDAEDRAQAQLDALEAQNDAVEDQIVLQEKLNALDKAKNTMQMVFKDGQFVYQADTDEVSKSQNELNAYYRQKDYENRKKYIEDSLKAEKEYIETLRKNETAALEEEKARWEEYKEGWSNLTSEYEFQQNKLLADQMFGIEQENANWQTRLANLQSFVSQYNALLGSLGGGRSGGYGGGSGVQPGEWVGLGDGGYASDADAWADIVNAYNPLWDKDTDYGELLEEGIKKGYGYDWIKGVIGQRNAKMQALGIQGESTADMWNRLKNKYGYNEGYSSAGGTSSGGTGNLSDNKVIRDTTSTRTKNRAESIMDEIERNSKDWFDADEEERKRLHERNELLRKKLESGRYASGTTSAKGGISMVGEQGPELRVLNQGDGIIPADITRNLMKIGSDPRWFANRSGAGNTILNVANVSLPSVHNAQQFVDGLKQMAIQRSYAAT